MNHKIPKNIVDNYVGTPSALIIQKASDLQEDIRDVLGSDYETFLQGSYRNNTAIHDLNDVDIVALRKETYSGVYSKKQLEQHILWDTIFGEVEAILSNGGYGGKLTRGDKCIHVAGQVNADVVPAVKIHDDHLLDPIAIHSRREQKEQKNYPRIHYENNVEKHQATQEVYKPAVRMFKGWVTSHFNDPKIAPSFFVEAAVYNSPNDVFHQDLAETFARVGIKIQEQFQAQYIQSVAGDKNIFTEWDPSNRSLFISQLSSSVETAIEALRATSEASAQILWRRVFNE